MSIETELRRTIELRNSLNNIKLEKADVLRQRQTIGQIRKQSAELRQLTKEFNRYVKRGGQVADGFEKGKWDKAKGNTALGSRVISIINMTSLAASFAGLGLSIGNTWLGQVRNEVNENKFDLYGKELGNQLKLILNQKKRIDNIERTQQRNTADLDILSGAMGQQTIKVNRLETGQTFLNGQFAILQNGFNTATQAFNGALQGTRNELINRIEAIKRDIQNPPPQFNSTDALAKARQALDTALRTAKKQTEQEQRIKKLERDRTAGFQNQLRIAQQRANQALSTANTVKNNFQKGIDNIAKEVERAQKLAEQREKAVSEFLAKKQDKSQILDLVSNNINRFYETYLKPSVDLQLKPIEIKADVAVQAVSQQQREINSIKQDLTFIERNFNTDINQLRKDIDNAGMNRLQEKKLDEILLTVGVLGGLAPTLRKGQTAIQTGLNQLRTDMPNLTAQGVCRTMQPGGCSRNALDGLGNSVNNNTNRWGNILDKANAAANAGQLAILNRLDSKMGPQLNGGLSGAIKRIFDNAIVDRAIAYLTYITALHNAFQLSNALTQTLFSTADTILQALGIKLTGANGEELNTGQIVNAFFFNFFKSIFGEDNATGMRQTWLQYSRIYQAASNMYSGIQSMFDCARSIAEMTVANVGKIGNALKKAGAVYENAYNWMSEKASAATARQQAFERFRQGLEQAENVTSSIENVASNVISIQSELNEFKNNKNQFDAAISGETQQKEQEEQQNKPNLTITFDNAFLGRNDNE